MDCDIGDAEPSRVRRNGAIRAPNSRVHGCDLLWYRSVDALRAGTRYLAAHLEVSLRPCRAGGSLP